MDFDKYADQILSEMADAKMHSVYQILRKKIKPVDIDNFYQETAIADYMVEKGLIKGVSQSRNHDYWDHHKITPFGVIVLDSGGWLSYLNSLRDQSIKEIANQSAEKKKDSRRYWITNGIAILAVLVSGYTLVRPDKSDELIQQITILKQQRDSLSKVTTRHDSLLRMMDKEIKALPKRDSL